MFLIGLSDKEMSEPCFKFQEIKYGIRTKENLAFPGMLNDELSFAIQCESKQTKRGPLGFIMVDEHIISHFIKFAELKIEQILT